MLFNIDLRVSNSRIGVENRNGSHPSVHLHVCQPIHTIILSIHPGAFLHNHWMDFLHIQYHDQGSRVADTCNIEFCSVPFEYLWTGGFYSYRVMIIHWRLDAHKIYYRVLMALCSYFRGMFVIYHNFLHIWLWPTDHHNSNLAPCQTNKLSHFWNNSLFARTNLQSSGE